MDLLIWAVYAFSLFTFAGSFVLFFFLYSVSGAEMIKRYLFYMGCGFFQLLTNFIGRVYFFQVDSVSLLQGMLWFRYFSVLATAGFTVTAPAFFLTFARQEYTPRLRRIFTTLAVLVLAVSPLIFVPLERSIVPYIPDILGLLTSLGGIFYGQYRIIKAYPELKDRLARVGIPAIVIYNIVSLVIGTIDSTVSQGQIQGGEYPYGVLFLPIIYIFWNLLSFAWVLRYYTLFLKTIAPSFDPETIAAGAYGFTNREAELIQLLSAGLTNKEIAAKLNISLHTVRNHVHNTFQKTGSKSRVELLRKLM